MGSRTRYLRMTHNRSMQQNLRLENRISLHLLSTLPIVITFNYIRISFASWTYINDKSTQFNMFYHGRQPPQTITRACFGVIQLCPINVCCLFFFWVMGAWLIYKLGPILQLVCKNV